MSQPLFQIGEEVKLVSKSLPEYNGDYVVLQVIKGGDKYLDPYSNNILKSSESNTFGYILDGDFPPDNHKGIFHSPMFCESALRKKYPPADFTFDELLANIRSSDLIST